MRIAAGLAALAAGAILTFAVSARVPGINLRLAGVIIILAAIAGLIATSQAAQAWLHRSEPSPAPPAVPDEEEFGDLGYLLQDPAVLAAEVLNGIRADSWPQASTAPDSGAPGSWTPDSWPQPAAARAGSRSRRPAGPRPLHSVRFDSEDGVG
jgi:hypothetical protein